jgi:hypothetical protein
MQIVGPDGQPITEAPQLPRPATELAFLIDRNGHGASLAREISVPVRQPSTTIDEIEQEFHHKKQKDLAAAQFWVEQLCIAVKLLAKVVVSNVPVAMTALLLVWSSKEICPMGVGRRMLSRFQSACNYPHCRMRRWSLSSYSVLSQLRHVEKTYCPHTCS